MREFAVPRNRSKTKRRIIGAVVIVLLLGVVFYLKRRVVGPLPIRPGVRLDAPAQMATWPWKKAVKDSPHPGVTHWLDRSSSDGTVLDLFEFDFDANPNLRLELYDQDEDDATPFNDEADYWHRSVGHVTRYLNEKGRGKVVAAWNGLFFGMDYTTGGPKGVGRHVAPVVLRGKVYFNVGNHRWTFGVKYENGKPVFKAMHLPDRATLAREYDFAAAGAQCLIRDGKPLKLQPFPNSNEEIKARGATSSTPDEAGHIRMVDHIRTSRTSMGWSQDNRRFYLLIVKEPDSETASGIALRRRVPLMGGWMLSDLQRFWQAKKVWGAVNVDGGEETQLTYLRPNGKYDMVPPRWGDLRMRLTFPPAFPNAPGGGALMYFYVRDIR